MENSQYKQSDNENTSENEDEYDDYDNYSINTEQANRLSQSSDDEQHKVSYSHYSTNTYNKMESMSGIDTMSKGNYDYDYSGSDDQSDTRGKRRISTQSDEYVHQFYSSNPSKRLETSKSHDSTTSIDNDLGGSTSDDQNESTNFHSNSSDDEMKYPTHSFYSPNLSTTRDTTMNSSSSKKNSLTTNYESLNYNHTDSQYNSGSNMSGIAKNIMEKLGYKENEGLGINRQGRLEPIQASTHKGRTGLGFATKGLDNSAVEFDPKQEVINLREHVEWLHSDYDDLYEINRDLLDSWIKVGNKKMTIDDETQFCDPDILEQLLKAKSCFDDLSESDMKQARSRSNPFETIDRCIFLNRAAVKMANLDYLCDWMFTNPIDVNGESLIRANDLLYFADVCAGPGGFTEYVLWRKKWRAKGFGFTLKACNDFKLDNFYSASPDTFDPYYGVKEDGDVFDPENIKSFTNYVLKQTDIGVHFMMADGGFSVEGKENIQEILSKQLYLCQFIVALSIVREKGHFVCKLFDIFTPFSVGLIYLMYKCFQQITIIKPNTSRPANSERYIVCKWKKSNTDTIQRHLFDINQEMWVNSDSNVDTLELVPYEVLKNDEKFFKFIVESNNKLGSAQIINLRKIAAFSCDIQLNEMRQGEMKSKCLELWQLPDEIPKKPVFGAFDKLCDELLGQWKTEKVFLSAREKKLCKAGNLQESFNDVHDWYFVALDTPENSDKNVRTLFISYGGKNVGMYNTSGEYWTYAPIPIELSPKTLVYGEIVKELQGEGKSQTVTYAFHIIDGLIVGGEDIRNFRLKKRNEICQTFAKALNKPRKKGKSDSIPIRCKPLFQMTELNHFFDKLSNYKLKNGKLRLGYKLQNFVEPERFYVPRGLLFFKETKQSLQKVYSKTHQCFYYFDQMVKKAFFLSEIQNPDQIYASFKSTFISRKLWEWHIETQVSETLRNDDPNSEFLFRTDFMDFISSKLSY